MAASRHPSRDITGSEGMQLAGKRVVLCVAGSVAAYKAIEAARLLMRHGADVECVASSAASRLIRPEYLKWATGNDVITKLTGDLEHIRLADRGGSDLIIAYPATANTVGKLANGIDDTPVSTVLTVGLGAKIPILVCPAMHASMYENAAVKRNVAFLKKRGVRFAEPSIIEGKAKAPEPDAVLAAALRILGGRAGPLAKKSVLLAAGPTYEAIDAVRGIMTASSGQTGAALACELGLAGARVHIVYGPGRAQMPPGHTVERVTSSKEMLGAVKKQLKKRRFDAVIMAAAVADYVPAKQTRSKIPSGKRSVTVRLIGAPKIIRQVKKMQPGALLVGFKAESGCSASALEAQARRSMAESGADIVVANDVGSAAYRSDPSRNELAIISGKRTVRTGRKKKQALAKIIVREIERAADGRPGRA